MPGRKERCFSLNLCEFFRCNFFPWITFIAAILFFFNLKRLYTLVFCLNGNDLVLTLHIMNGLYPRQSVQFYLVCFIVQGQTHHNG